MANPIRRLVQLILDKAAAARLEADAKKTVGGVEKSLGGLGAAAKRIGALLAAAFGIRALIAFGKAAVQEALESQKAWSDLAGTIRATGKAFEDVEDDLVALSKAFQEATTHTDEAYAQSLTRLITLTGDVAASTNNMGLVANVAAQFFGGELAPAVELVSKVMNGNLTLLKRMGISVKSAQEGLEVLAARSFGAAERQANTFGGKLQQLTNLWNDFKEELGGVLVSSNETAGGLDVLRGMVLTLTQAVKDNRQELAGGFKTALEGTVIVLDGVYRGVRGVAEVLGGVLFFAIGTLLSPLVLLGKALALIAEGGALISKTLGMEGATKALNNFAERVDALAEALRKPTGVGLEMLGEGLKRFTERTQIAEDALSGIRNPAGARLPNKKLFGATPQVGKNAEPGEPPKAKELNDAEKALQAFEEAMASARAMSGLLGKDFDMASAEASALTSVLEDLGRLGFDNNDPIMQEFAARLLEISHAGDEAAQKLAALKQIEAEATEQMRKGAEVAGLFGEALGAALGSGIGPWAAYKAKMNLIEAAELGVRALVSLFNPFTAWQAGPLAAAAAKHLAIAAAWGALAGATGGFSSGGGGGSGSLSGARGAAGNASQGARQMGADVTIVLDGHFDALNPEVQSVVYESHQRARERFGENANVRLARRR